MDLPAQAPTTCTKGSKMKLVMPALVAGIHVLNLFQKKTVSGLIGRKPYKTWMAGPKPGHDDENAIGRLPQSISA
ncbi:hypothetical protein [Blastochloris tepida]|uniref:hypothetical protein n=1 Tax=Blastochloris tepida TaxID=2233851 RepID=UPI0011AE9732|nr:hypothetical protein [Blastochloris tepida]